MSWTEIARRQHGVLTYRQLRDAGVGAAALATLHRRGVLTPDSYGREVWQVAGAPTTTLTHCWAAFLRTGGTLSHYTAGWLWAMLPAPTVGAGLHVTLSGRKPLRRLPGVIMHRVPLTAKERTERDGLLLTTRSRTVIDCVRVLPRRPAITLLDRALQQKWISLDQLDTELALTKGRHGTPQLRALRAACAEGDAESERTGFSGRPGSAAGWPTPRSTSASPSSPSMSCSPRCG